MSIATKCTCGYSVSGICLDRIVQCKNLIRNTTMTETTATREPGNYHVKYTLVSEWEVARFDGQNWYWHGFAGVESIPKFIHPDRIPFPDEAPPEHAPVMSVEDVLADKICQGYDGCDEGHYFSVPDYITVSDAIAAIHEFHNQFNKPSPVKG